MTQTLNSKEVIESLQTILIELEKRRLYSKDKKRLHKANRNIAFRHFFQGELNAYQQSYNLLEDFLDRLIIKK